MIHLTVSVVKVISGRDIGLTYKPQVYKFLFISLMYSAWWWLSCSRNMLLLFRNIIAPVKGTRGGVVVKALLYKSAGRGFYSRWCYWNFSVTWSFRSHNGPGVDSASNRNDYQVYFLTDNLTTILCRCHEIWEPELPGTLWATPGL